MGRHHPGPPQFTTVEATVEFAPRDPDPTASYQWHITDAPVESTATVSETPVVEFTPDVPGQYTLTLEAPDGTHEVPVRAYPQSRPRDEADPEGYTFADAEYGEPVPDEGDEDTDRPRVRLDGERDGDTVVITATVQPPVGSDTPPEAFDVDFVADTRGSLTADDLTVEGHTATVPLEAIGEESRLHAVALGETHSVADAIALRSSESDDGVEIERLNEPPAWSKDITLYEIFLRSFAEGEEATFDAVAEKLPYLADLGIDCIWLSPVLQNDEFPHGYNITDFFSIADDLGSREEFEAFVEACHDHGMKVLFDLVLNHSAREHEFYRAALEDDPKYVEWYDWEDREAKEPKTYFDWPYIANFNFDNLEVRRHLLDAVDEWAPVVDGFRCDMAWAVPTNFWQEIRDRVKAHDADFLLLDETIPYIPDFHEGCFDVHFDTTLYFALREVGHGALPAESVTNAVDERSEIGFPDHAAFLQYIENHDETRYLEECGRDQLEAAAGAIFTLPGIPMLYAGQEIGERERRAPIQWDDADESLLAYYRSLIELRERHPAVGYHGSFEPVAVEASHEGVTAYAREADGERLIVVLNFGPVGEVVDLPGESVDTVDRISGADVSSDDGDLLVESCVVVTAPN